MAKNEMQIIRETQVNTPKSLLTIKPGATVRVSCSEFSPMGTVASAISRLNQRAGRIEFEASTPDKGATIVIHRNK